MSVVALEGLELVDATFTTHAFPLHAHAEYVIGAVVAGAKRTQIGRDDVVVGAGSLTLFNPFEEHASRGAGESWRFTALYPTRALVNRYFGERRMQFRRPVVCDDRSTRLVRTLHSRLAAPATRLDAEVAFVECLDRLFLRHGNAPTDGEGDGGENIRRARMYLDDDPSGRLGLCDLARLSGLPPPTFLRTFRRAVGCTPRVYATARRIAAAKRALRAGVPAASVAADFGFCDQGHFTRVFHRWTGSTPALFAAQTRGSA